MRLLEESLMPDKSPFNSGGSLLFFTLCTEESSCDAGMVGALLGHVDPSPYLLGLPPS